MGVDGRTDTRYARGSLRRNSVNVVSREAEERGRMLVHAMRRRARDRPTQEIMAAVQLIWCIKPIYASRPVRLRFRASERGVGAWRQIK